MATIGKLSEFVPGNETLAAYSERVKLLFIANNVLEEKHAAVLQSVFCGKMYNLL